MKAVSSEDNKAFINLAQSEWNELECRAGVVGLVSHRAQKSIHFKGKRGRTHGCKWRKAGSSVGKDEEVLFWLFLFPQWNIDQSNQLRGKESRVVGGLKREEKMWTKDPRKWERDLLVSACVIMSFKVSTHELQIDQSS